mgnify:CR=1 FL=1
MKFPDRFLLFCCFIGCSHCTTRFGKMDLHNEKDAFSLTFFFQIEVLHQVQEICNINLTFHCNLLWFQNLLPKLEQSRHRLKRKISRGSPKQENSSASTYRCTEPYSPSIQREEVNTNSSIIHLSNANSFLLICSPCLHDWPQRLFFQNWWGDSLGFSCSS